MVTGENKVSTKGSYVLSITIIGALFFIFGFVTWANSQLIPYLKIACELTDTQSYFVATAFFAASKLSAAAFSAFLLFASTLLASSKLCCAAAMAA